MENGHQRDDLCYHHFSLTFDPKEVATRLQDVRFVLVAGCARRAEAFARYLLESNTLKGTPKLEELTRRDASRFSLFKLGPVLLANHGMGPASMSIALHELFLMCQQSQTIDKITLLRFGTCGGIGVSPGTICITNRAFDPLFNEFVELKICLKTVKRSAQMDTKLAQELYECFLSSSSSCTEAYQLGSSSQNGSSKEKEKKEEEEFDIKIGATVGTNDFYEEQGRTNGAICEHSLEDKRMFLERAREMGVINMEMESNHLAAMCNKLSVRFGVICVALNNRLLDDRVLLDSKQMVQFEGRLFKLISQFIRIRQLQM